MTAEPPCQEGCGDITVWVQVANEGPYVSVSPDVVVSLYGVRNNGNRVLIDSKPIGQYLQPTPKHHAVARYVTPEEFESYERTAFAKGFLMVSATPLTRSSYHAGDDFARLRTAREEKLSSR